MPQKPAVDVQPFDAFELPDWLGTGAVTWTATSSVRGAQHIHGCLASAGEALPCDLMAADVTYPLPLLPEPWRRQAHQAWEHGQVLLLSYAGRLTLAVPGHGVLRRRHARGDRPAREGRGSRRQPVHRLPAPLSL